MKRLNYFLSLALLLMMASCGGSSTDNDAEKTTVKKEAAAKEEVEMTVEKAANLEFEKAKLLMENYWPQIKGKSYDEVKDVYAQYQKEREEILNRYGVSTDGKGFDEQELIYFERDHRSELRKYRSEHPDLDFYTLYPEFTDAVAQCFNFDMEARKK